MNLAKTAPWRLAPAWVFLFVLPIGHTIAVRLSCLLLATILAVATWRRDPPPSPSFLWPVLPLAAWALASLAWSVDPAFSWREIQNSFLYSACAFASFYAVARDETTVTRLCSAILVALPIMAVPAIVSVIHSGHESWFRKASFGDPGTFSSYLINVLPIVLVTLAAERTRGVRIVGAIALLLIAVGAAITLNRAVWLAALAMAAVHFGLRARRAGRSWLRIGAVVLVATAIAIPAVGKLSVEFRPSPAGANQAPDEMQSVVTRDARWAIWRYASAMIEARPLTGYGFGRGILRDRMRPALGGDPNNWHAHNLFLNFALGVGVPAAFVLVLMFAVLAHWFWRRSIRADEPTFAMCTMGLTLIVGTLVKNMTDDIFIRDTSLLFWSIVGIAAGFAARQSRPAVETGHPG